jgi:hypothetical protein
MRQPTDDHRKSVSRRERLGQRANLWLIGAAAIGVLLGPALNSALASTQVSGGQNDLQIKVQSASIKEIFDAMSGRFHLTYKLPPNVGVRPELTGLYSGTLSQVLARILDGKDYVVEVSNQGLKVVVLKLSGTTAYRSPSQSAAVSERAVARGKSSRSATAPPAIIPSSNSSPPPLSTYVSANKPTTVGQATNP